MSAVQNLTYAFHATRAEARRERRRSLRDLLAGLFILVVWFALWSWIAVGVLAPLGRTGADPRPHEVAALRA